MSEEPIKLGSTSSTRRSHAQEAAQAYARLVQKHAQQVIDTSLYTRELFAGLSSLLSHVVIHKLFFSNGDTMTPRTTAISYISELEQLARAKPSEDDTTIEEGCRNYSIVIARGHQPPECLTRLGALFAVNPIFFQRHLEYVWRGRPQKLFPSPWPPSASFRVIRLRIVTIGDRGEDMSVGSNQQLEDLRANADDAIPDYLHALATETGIKLGHSIVRAFNVHSARYHSIEQEVTAIVHERDDGWDVLMWTDVGADLGEGPKGPWRPDRYRTSGAIRKSHFLPTVQHFPGVSLDALGIPTAHRKLGPFAQTSSSHGLTYGCTLDPDLMTTDSFYALTEMFQLSANTHSQLLNLIESIIQASTGYELHKSQDFSVANLSYHQDILVRIESRLRENISDLQRSKFHNWPALDCNNKSSDSDRRRRIEAAIDCLKNDFQQLLSRCEELKTRCTGGMVVCMNNAAIAESTRAIEQAIQIEQLTRLAFIYIPLSFATSFFGMNLKMFEQGNVKLTTWIAVSLPLMVVSYIALYISRKGWIEKVSRKVARSIMSLLNLPRSGA